MFFCLNPDCDRFKILCNICNMGKEKAILIFALRKTYFYFIQTFKYN